MLFASRGPVRLMLNCSFFVMFTALANPAQPQGPATSADYASHAIASRLFGEAGTALPGARITVRETGQQTTTNLQGEVDLPLRQAGEAVAIDGLRVSSIDPMTRVADLDTIPSGVVGSLEVVKALRPSQDADSIVGSINIVTRLFFDARGLRFGASGGLGHNPFGGNDRRAAASISTPLIGNIRQRVAEHERLGYTLFGGAKFKL